MILIPAIDLLDGKCVRLKQGDYNQVTVYGDVPGDMAKRWEDTGAERLHVVDLDGAKTGKPSNLSAIESIRKNTNMKIEVGGGIRTTDNIKTLLNIGVNWTILGTVALEDKDLTHSAVEQFGDKIIIGIDAKNGNVATRGWLTESDTKATSLAKELSELGIGAIIYTDIARDGMMIGPNLEALQEVASVSKCPVIASGGISKLEDLISIRDLDIPNIIGAISGKALYTGDLDAKEAIKNLKFKM